jgi:hypothetical protein
MYIPGKHLMTKSTGASMPMIPWIYYKEPWINGKKCSNAEISGSTRLICLGVNPSQTP